MSDLKPCKCGGIPVEQTRKDMKPQDHHMQYARHAALVDLAEKHGVVLDIDEFRRDAYDVECLDDNRYDFRISCPKCGRATGWDKPDVGIERDVNKDNVRNRWNEMN